MAKPFSSGRSRIRVNATAADPTVKPDEDQNAWISGFQAGEESVFRKVVVANREGLYAVARRLLGNHTDADEATQQAFVRAWKSRRQFRGDAALRTWLIRIVINVCHSIRSARRPQDPLESMSDPVDPRERADVSVESRERDSALHRAIERLPERQRMVVTLKVLSEMTHKEVAEAMEISEGAVKAHLHQAVSNLRGLMHE